MIKTLFINCAWNNRGDEAAFRALIDALKESYGKKMEITFIWGYEDVAQFPYSLDEMPREMETGHFSRRDIPAFLLAFISRGKICINNRMKKLCNSYTGADMALISPGGPSIGDLYPQAEISILMCIMMLKRMRIPYIFCAPSGGPYNNRFRNIFRKYVYRNAEFVCFREEMSAKYYETLKIEKKPYVTLDNAFQNKIDSTAQSAKLEQYTKLKEFMQKHEKCVGITITTLNFTKHKNNYVLIENIKQTFTEEIQCLTDNGYGVVFIPQLFGEGNDSDLMSEFCTDNCFLVSDEQEYDCYFQQYLISKLYAVIGMRYHSNIFSAKMCTPFISISYEQKMQGFMEIAGLSDYCLPVEELSFRLLQKKFELLCANYEQYNEKLHEINKKLTKKSKQTTTYICDFINNNLCEKL